MNESATNSTQKLVDNPGARYDLPIPPAHLSSTNNPPSESEASDIRRTILQRHTHLSQLKNTIQGLRDSLAVLEEEFKALQCNIDQHSAVLSPMRRFPAEILGEIFWWTVPPSDYSQWPPRFAAYSPWNISCVCDQWRSICMASPKLWTRINVRGNYPIRTLEAQLERSNPQPLTINFTSTGAKNDIEVFKLLLASSARWRIVYLSPEYPALNCLTSSDNIQRPLPELRTLVFTTSSRGPICKAFESAPKLTNVVLRGKTHRALLPFPQLTRLRLRLHSFESPDSLRLARNLIQLTLIMPIGWDEPSALPDPVELPQLRMLYLDDGRYLESLLLPALEDIYIMEHGKLLPGFIERSSCQLKKLTILKKDPHVVPSLGRTESALDIIPILDLAPTLLELRLGPILQTDDFIRYLIIPAADGGPIPPPVCPQLRHLSLWNISENDYPLALKLVDSRRKSIDIP
ncbi:hypothetical protein B0H11DRAFT_1844635, partial [Mycena galericulata]